VDEELKNIARTLVWWKPPEEVERLYLVRRVMNDGTLAMQRLLMERYGEEVFRQALAGAELGQLSPRAWNYWHLRLGLEPIPPLPMREVPLSPYVSAEIVRLTPRPAVAVASA
jgi:hypothetical protein